MSGPKRIPVSSKKSISSCLAKFRVPLKAMCSTKCASPRWSSSSWSDPALSASHSSARFSGLRLART